MSALSGRLNLDLNICFHTVQNIHVHIETANIWGVGRRGLRNPADTLHHTTPSAASAGLNRQLKEALAAVRLKWEVQTGSRDRAGKLGLFFSFYTRLTRPSHFLFLIRGVKILIDFSHWLFQSEDDSWEMFELILRWTNTVSTSCRFLTSEAWNTPRKWCCYGWMDGWMDESVFI